MPKLTKHGHTTSMMTPHVEKVKAFLDDAPLHEVWDAKEIVNLLKLGYKQACNHLCDLGPAYRYWEKGRYWYGHPQTIKNKQEGLYDEEES